MTNNGIELQLLGDDGQGNRLWIDVQADKVANESYDSETGESFGLNDDIEGWNYSAEDSLI